MGVTLTWWAALIGLALAILCIIKKLNTTYALVLGAIVGCVLGGATLPETVKIVISGSQSVMGTVVRVLAPIAGVLMGAAAASTSTAVILGSNAFGSTILGFGVSPVAAAVTMQAGATVIDALPHGNYFHVTGKSMNMTLGERLAVLPYEALVGITMTVVASVMYLVF